MENIAEKCSVENVNDARNNLSTQIQPHESSSKPSFSSKVAEHYNGVPEKGINERTKSRIFYLRNFNNWIKSMLIGEFLERIKSDGCDRATVLDLCCGKGGDLMKWRSGNVLHLVATDIASLSLEQCEQRYRDIRARDRSQSFFTSEFILADVTKDRLLSFYANQQIQFDLCSCQFSLHYSFESEKQARVMIRNAVERLKPGGYFIGSLPDAERILHCIRSSESETYSNDILRLELGDVGIEKKCPSLFGSTFNFQLDTQVNCAEFFVYFPVLERLIGECGMELVYKKRFPDAFYYFLNKRNGRPLLGKMQALEPYPPESDIRLMGGEESYREIDAKLNRFIQESGDQLHRTVGTLSKSEWEVTAMYLIFAFRKKKPF